MGIAGGLILGLISFLDCLGTISWQWRSILRPAWLGIWGEGGLNGGANWLDFGDLVSDDGAESVGNGWWHLSVFILLLKVDTRVLGEGLGWMWGSYLLLERCGEILAAKFRKGGRIFYERGWLPAHRCLESGFIYVHYNLVDLARVDRKSVV